MNGPATDPFFQFFELGTGLVRAAKLFVARRHADDLPILGADADHELAAHDRNGAAIALAVDRHADRWPLAGTETRNDRRGDLDPQGALVIAQDREVRNFAVFRTFMSP